MNKDNPIFIIFPTQLYENISLLRNNKVFLVEDKIYFTKYNFHKLKISFHRATMKKYQDYLLSKKVSSNKFKITNKTIFTLPRRFENKGLWYMTKLMIQSFFNRNNKGYFSNHNSYWK